MIVDDFNVARTAVWPIETDSPLIVNSDAVLTRPITRQFFESVTWRGQQIAQVFRIIQIKQLASRRTLNIVR